MNKVLFNLLKGNTLLFILMFINSIVLARLYTTNEIGIIRTLNLYGSIIIVVGTFQLHVSILRYVTRIPQDYFRIVCSIKFVGLISIIVTVLYYLVVLIFLLDSLNLEYYLLYGLILIPLVFFNMLQNFYIVTNQSKKIAKQMLLFGFLFVLLTVLVGYFNCDIRYYFFGLFIIYLIMLLPWKNHILLQNHGSFGDFEIQRIIDQVRYSIPLTFSNLIYFLMSKFDSFWMTLNYSASIVGAYLVVAFENPLNGIVISSSMNEITHSMSKLFDENKIKELWRKWQDSIFTITSLLFLPSLLLFSNASFFIEFVFGSKYLDNVYVFKLYCLVPIFRTASYQSLLRVFNHTKFHLINTILSFIVTAITAVLISMYLDFLYFPIAYMMGYFSYNIGVVIYICKKENVPFVRVYGISIILKQLFVATVVYSLFLILNIERFGFVISNLILVALYILFYSIMFFKKIKKIFHEINL